MYKFLAVTSLAFCAVACSAQDTSQKEASHEAKMTRQYQDLVSKRNEADAKINDFLAAKAFECKPGALNLTPQGRLVCVKVTPPPSAPKEATVAPAPEPKPDPNVVVNDPKAKAPGPTPKTQDSKKQ